MSQRRRRSSRLISLVTLLLLLSFMSAPVLAAPLRTESLATVPSALDRSYSTYTNPLRAQIPGGGLVESCADPSIIHAQTPGDTNWYVFCTTDPLNSADKNASGGFNFHLVPILRSPDLAHWTYVGDAFASKPAWVDPGAGLWAPDIHFFNGQYYLYYTASWTNLQGGGSAIGVATSASPAGPWVDSGAPVVEPQDAPCCAGARRWVFDPALVTDASGQAWIFYGSYFGGIAARKLSADGLHSDPASQVQIAIDNRYEGSFVVRHGGYYYLFASATNCCNGPLTGYSVFVGRSTNVTGPYIDAQGRSFADSATDGRAGGTPVLTMNGNRFVGPGHNAVFTDFAGQDWVVYHAVDSTDPYFDVGFTKRPLMMDPLDWIDGWPNVRAGRWASDSPQPAPAAQPGQSDAYRPKPPDPLKLTGLLPQFSDDFNGTSLSPQWTWVRAPAAGAYREAGGDFSFDTQNADLYVDSNNASVLTEPEPSFDYVVETKVRINWPIGGCCQNYVQAGLVIYGNDDNFIKLVPFSNWDTRQTEFAKELSPVPAGYPRYGNTVVSAPGDWTYLRVAVRHTATGETYQAYTSPDGKNWARGGVWTHALGTGAKIGLVSMGGSGFTADFDYVRVYRLGD